MKHVHELKRSHGSAARFIQCERVRWGDGSDSDAATTTTTTITPSGRPPFTDPTDYRILFNDWPYAVAADIAHLVVWTKFPLDDDGDSGDSDSSGVDMAPRTKALIDGFVARTFCSGDSDGEAGVGAGGGLARDQVAWFKNWHRLKSIHGLEHFHVMTQGAPREFLDRVTGGDQPMVEKEKKEEEG